MFQKKNIKLNKCKRVAYSFYLECRFPYYTKKRKSLISVKTSQILTQKKDLNTFIILGLNLFHNEFPLHHDIMTRETT